MRSECMKAGLLAALAAGVIGTRAPLAHAGVLFTDGFDDADRNNDGVTDDGTAAPVTSPNGVPFYLGRGTSSATVSVVNDNAAGGLGGGFAVQNVSTTTSTRPLVTTFATQTLAGGDAISIGFDYRLTGTVPDSDRQFRFGLYNNGGTAVTGDTSTTATTSDDVGYYVTQDTGTGLPATNANVLSLLGNPAGTLLGGTGIGLGATTTNTAYGLPDTSKHHAVFTIARNANGDLAVSLALDSLAVLTGNAVNGNATTSPLTYAFNEFAIGENGVALGYVLDNVTATFTPAPPTSPEPAGLAALAGMGLLLGGRRRS